MAGANKVPERLIGFKVYNEDYDLLGIATIELPTLESMSETVAGAGILGEIEHPTLGNYASMTTSFTWNTITKRAMMLAAPGPHKIEARGSQQIFNASENKFETEAIRCVMDVTPKSTGLGTLETNATTDTEQEFEVSRLVLYVGKQEMVKIDKFNYEVAFGGKDILASVRKDLGMN